MEKILWLRAKTEANVKPELRKEVAWNACDKELGGEKKFVFQTWLEIFQKSLPFSEIYVKHLEKNSIQVWLIAGLLSFLYQFPVKSNICHTHSIPCKHSINQ